MPGSDRFPYKPNRDVLDKDGEAQKESSLSNTLPGSFQEDRCLVVAGLSSAPLPKVNHLLIKHRWGGGGGNNDTNSEELVV